MFELFNCLNVVRRSGSTSPLFHFVKKSTKKFASDIIALYIYLTIKTNENNENFKSNHTGN